jgi:TatD DNase family protein
MVDSHCHLAGEAFETDLAAVVARARTAGLLHALVILNADDEQELTRAAAMPALWDGVRFATGVHPHNAGRFERDPDAAAAIVETALDTNPFCRAVGETGLDYHYDFAPRAAQQAVFAAQIRLALRRRLPLVIHTREADVDTHRILDEEGASEVGVVFHCFTGTIDAARQALERGYYISLAGIVTFPRAQELREVAAMVPLDRLLVETDSPFLAPVPFRGRRNEPAHVTRVVKTLAEVRGVPADTVAAAALANFTRLFAP